MKTPSSHPQGQSRRWKQSDDDDSTPELEAMATMDARSQLDDNGEQSTVWEREVEQGGPMHEELAARRAPPRGLQRKKKLSDDLLADEVDGVYYTSLCAKYQRRNARCVRWQVGDKGKGHGRSGAMPVGGKAQ